MTVTKKKSIISDIESLSSLRDFLDARNMKFTEITQKKKVLREAEVQKQTNNANTGSAQVALVIRQHFAASKSKQTAFNQ